MPVSFIRTYIYIEVIRQNVFSHAIIMVIGVSSDLKENIRRLQISLRRIKVANNAKLGVL